MSSPPDPSVKPALSEHGARRALLFLMVAYAALYTILCWRRYATFHAQIDLSYYLRLVWGLAHGHYDLPLVQCQHVLGLHLEPILAPLVVLRRLGVPGAPLLLVTQAVAVALLAWPAYRLARRHLGAPGPALGFAAAALLYPTVTVATLHDFHPVTLALVPLLGVIDALDEGRLGRALGLGLLALACREDIAGQLTLLYLAYAIKPPADWKITSDIKQYNKRRIALILMSIGLVVYFLIYIVLIQKRYVPRFGSYGLHFGALPGAESARSGRDLLLLLLRRPDVLVRLVLSADRLLYVLQLVAPVLLLPLLAPRVLVGALPILAVNFLSAFPNVRSIESHYTTALVPFVLGAAALGAGRLRALWPRAGTARGIVLGVLGGTLLSHVGHGGSPLALRSPRFHWEHFTSGPGDAELRARIAAVPGAASVAARPGPLAHLAERPRAISPPEYDDAQPVDVVLSPEAQPTGERRIGNRRLE